MRVALSSLIIVAALATPACAMLSGSLKTGEVLTVSQISTVQEVQGDTTEPLDPRVELRGRMGRVLPVGAQVEIGDRDDPYAHASGSNAPLAALNPWVFVKVVSSPAQAQKGWLGWIHKDTLRAQGAASSAKTKRVTLARPSNLCPDADSNRFQCSFNVAAKTPVDVVACGESQVQVDVWSRDGMYTSGFIKRSQFDNDPCGQTSTKEP